MRVQRFSISKAFDFILDEQRSPYLRAIRLFQLQVAITLCMKSKKANSDQVNNFTIRVPRGRLRAARTHAILKMLEHVEATIRPTKTDDFSTDDLLSDDNYRTLLTTLITDKGGIQRVRRVARAQTLDRILSDARVECSSISKLANFSLRFKFNPEKPKQIGGRTMALAIVPECKNYFRTDYSGESMKGWCVDRLQVIGLLYLIYVEKYYLMRPPKICKRSFVPRLLSIVGNRAELLEFVAKYEKVRCGLNERGYPVPKLEVKAELPEVSLNLDPLPQGVLDHIGAYTK